MTRARVLLLFELALFAGLGIADIYGLVPLSRTPFLVALGWISLRRRGLRWRDVGFTRPPNWLRAIALGTIFGVAMELFSTYVTVPFFTSLTGQPPDLSDFRFVVGDLRALLFVLALNWTLAAFGEELGYRAYVMSRIADLGQGTRRAWVFALIVGSAYFGWGHEAQAVTGMIQETFAGLLLGLMYLGTRRNLTVPIVAHGVSNTVAFTLIYLDRYPGV